MAEISLSQVITQDYSFFNHFVETGSTRIQNRLYRGSFAHLYQFFQTGNGNKIQKITIVLMFYIMNYFSLLHDKSPVLSDRSKCPKEKTPRAWIFFRVL
jgi:hypothetical protein